MDYPSYADHDADTCDIKSQAGSGTNQTFSLINSSQSASWRPTLQDLVTKLDSLPERNSTSTQASDALTVEVLQDFKASILATPLFKLVHRKPKTKHVETQATNAGLKADVTLKDLMAIGGPGAAKGTNQDPVNLTIARGRLLKRPAYIKYRLVT